MPVSARNRRISAGVEFAAHGKSVVALVVFDRLPRSQPRHAVGVQNKTQFDERALRRQHRFAPGSGRGGLLGRPGGRRLQQL